MHGHLSAGVVVRSISFHGSPRHSAAALFRSGDERCLGVPIKHVPTPAVGLCIVLVRSRPQWREEDMRNVQRFRHLALPDSHHSPCRDDGHGLRADGDGGWDGAKLLW
jgi:hypothetical protein